MRLKLGSLAPDFVAESIGGRRVSLEQPRGRPPNAETVARGPQDDGRAPVSAAPTIASIYQHYQQPFRGHDHVVTNRRNRA